MTERKRKPRMGAPRTEVFAMRLDPKLKYLAEIAARKQRRSLANFVEWAVEMALENVHLRDDFTTVAEASTRLWARDATARLVKLAANYPELLTYDEELFLDQVLDESYAKTRTMKEPDDAVAYQELMRAWEKLHTASAGSPEEELNAVSGQQDDGKP